MKRISGVFRCASSGGAILKSQVSCCNVVSSTDCEAMLYNVGVLLHPQPSCSLNGLSAQKARLPLHICSNSESKLPRLVARRAVSSKFRCRTPSRSQRQVVACTHANLQNAFQPVTTRDLTATALAAVGAYVWVRLFDWMANKGVLEQVCAC